MVNLGFRGSEAGNTGISGAGGVASTDSGTSGVGGSNPIGVVGSQPAAAGMQSNAGAAGLANAGAGGTAPAGSPGCGLPPPASDFTLQINGSTTSYIVDPATGYDRNRPYPLVVSFRGADVTASAFRRYLNLPAVVGADGIVVNLECADNGSTWDLQRDLPFFDALLTKVQAQYCVDPRRIFVVGHATGAAFANSLACMRGGVLRGLGSLSPSMQNPGCTTKIPVWITQGNADSAVALGRGNRDFWTRQNGCNASVQNPVDPSPCVAYGGCDSGFPVQYCEYDGTLNLPTFAASGAWAFFQSL